MHLYQEFTLAAAHDRQRRFRDEAQQRRLLSAFRPARGERRARGGAGTTDRRPRARGRPAIGGGDAGGRTTEDHRRATAPGNVRCRRYPCGVRTTRDGASSVMIGRQRELRRLSQLAVARRPEVAIVAGEPGIGKTRMVSELLDGLPEGTVTLVGHAEPGSLARPYEVLLDALYGRDDVDPDRLDALTDPARSAGERLQAGLRLVADVIAGAPAVIIFEDMHWIDSRARRSSNASPTYRARCCSWGRTGRMT
ncbi:ATP-binding protein [Luedemannella flava]